MNIGKGSYQKDLNPLRSTRTPVFWSNAASRELPQLATKAEGRVWTLVSCRTSRSGLVNARDLLGCSAMKNARLCSLVAFGLMGACSSADVPKANGDMSYQKEFTADDKRVAKVLSIGGEDSIPDASPQYRATLCSLALESIADRMLGEGILTNEQQEAFTSAQSLYSRRAAANASVEERAQLVSDVETSYPNRSERARFAIGCLRDLG